MGIKGTYLNTIKAIYIDSTVNKTLKGEKLKAFPLIEEQDKDAHSHHFYSTPYGKFYPQQSDGKKK